MIGVLIHVRMTTSERCPEGRGHLESYAYPSDIDAIVTYIESTAASPARYVPPELQPSLKLRGSWTLHNRLLARAIRTNAGGI